MHDDWSDMEVKDDGRGKHQRRPVRARRLL